MFCVFLGGDIVSFLYWLAFNVPLTIVIVLCTWLWLQIMYMGLWRPKSKAGKYKWLRKNIVNVH